MVETNFKYPMMDDEGKLFDRFPLIILHMNNGEKIKLNYFSEYAVGYKPTRYMLNSIDDKTFMPIVEYKSYFVSPQWTCKEFIRHATAKAKQNNDILQVSNNEFIFMNNVNKIEIDETSGDIICFKGTWSDKFFMLDGEPFVASIEDIVINKNEENVIEEVHFNVDTWMDNMVTK
jgi:hypothetical protein